MSKMSEVRLMNFKPRTQREKQQLEMYGAFTPGGYLNTIRFAKNETLLHLVGKAILAHKLRQRGNFLCEAYFEGGEFDLVSLSDKVSYEIVHSSNPPRLELPKQISECFVINLEEGLTIKELSRNIYKQANL